MLVEALNNMDVEYVPRPRETIEFGAARLRVAVREATRAYGRTGRMCDSALAYADLGFPVFPLDVRSKAPIPKRDRDPTGELKDGIPGTGGVYKATKDPPQILRWWRKHPKALIALPMGERSGVWCLDIDTPEDHADGVMAWDKVAGEHEPIVTREHRSATGGPHLIFTWSEEVPIRCSAGALPAGVEVKGQGGYIVVPPSIRKGRAYGVHNDIDPVLAPQWLIDCILQGRSQATNGWDQSSFPAYDVDLDDLRDALLSIPNPDDWVEWKNMALRLYAGLGEQGFALFDQWSQQWDAYNLRTGGAENRECWQQVCGSPPDRTGINKIFSLAREQGWTRKLRELPPAAKGGDNVTIQPDAADEVTPEVARDEIRRAVRAFLDRVAIPESEQNHWTRLYFAQLDPESVVPAINAPTGISKTQIAIAEVAKWMRETKAGPIIYCVPMHRLSERIDEQFAAHGVNARVFYGRDHADPDKSGDRQQQIKMCLNPAAVEVAVRAHADISRSCCKNGKKKCVYLNACGYYRQQEDAKTVQIWVVASNMLFHAQRAFGKPVAVIADESFWQRGLRGIEQIDCEVPLASLKPDKPLDFDNISGNIENCRDYDRALLCSALGQQVQNGPVERQYLETTTSPAFKHEGKIRKAGITKLTPGICGRAIAMEWHLMPKLKLEPGMSQAEIARVCTPEKVDEIRHARNIITIWSALRQFLNRHKWKVSGRLMLKQTNGQRTVQWRGVARISKQATVPTLLLDATLPDRSILQVYHPQVETVLDLKIAMPPHVRIKQVLDAPTSSNKLASEKHLEAVRRYILRRWDETGRRKTLVICQLKVEQWLIERGLPDSIHVEHYNAIAGLDDYRDVRLMILIGRTAPGPTAIEVVAAALSGQQPDPCKPAAARSRFTWYPATKRGIRLRDGRMIETRGDEHPDAVAEPVRWQVHEGELLQGFGRARALNRSAANPLDADLLFDTALPITVDEVVRWRTPSLLLAPAFDDGVMSTAPIDMVRLWPALWPNTRAADRTLQQGVPELPGFVAVDYRLKGPKMNQRIAFFDPTIIPDPKTWLEQRLGPLL